MSIHEMSGARPQMTAVVGCGLERPEPLINKRGTTVSERPPFHIGGALPECKVLAAPPDCWLLFARSTRLSNSALENPPGCADPEWKSSRGRSYSMAWMADYNDPNQYLIVCARKSIPERAPGRELECHPSPQRTIIANSLGEIEIEAPGGPRDGKEGQRGQQARRVLRLGGDTPQRQHSPLIPSRMHGSPQPEGRSAVRGPASGSLCAPPRSPG